MPPKMNTWNPFLLMLSWTCIWIWGLPYKEAECCVLLKEVASRNSFLEIIQIKLSLPHHVRKHRQWKGGSWALAEQPQLEILSRVTPHGRSSAGLPGRR